MLAVMDSTATLLGAAKIKNTNQNLATFLSSPRFSAEMWNKPTSEKEQNAPACAAVLSHPGFVHIIRRLMPR